jgi:hypothetical protein
VTTSTTSTSAASLVGLDPSEPPADELAPRLARQGFAVVGARALASRLGEPHVDLSSLARHWDDLPADAYLLDGGKYRFRRHGCFVQHVRDGRLEPVPERAHFQPTTYNALHGGLDRWFSPLAPELASAPAFTRLVEGLGGIFAEVRAPEASRWYVEAHAFRIDTKDGVGRPTPEGAHRDGVDFVAVVFVGRANVTGGETRVFEAHGPQGVRFSLREPWSALLLDDTRVIHETTPIVPAGEGGRRDTLVLTYRSRGFQSRESP